MDDRNEVDTAHGKSSKGRVLAIAGPILTVFAILTAGVTIAAYRFGEGVIYLNDRTISDMNMFEVTGGAAVGVLGIIAGLAATIVGAVVALAATILGLSVGALGLALGVVVTVGVLTGPILLIGLIIVLVRRRYWPDVI